MNPTNRGTIAAWAWGFQRCVDYLMTDRDIDTNRIAIVGHSRNGKAALLAAAFDERVAMAIYMMNITKRTSLELPRKNGCVGKGVSC